MRANVSQVLEVLQTGDDGAVAGLAGGTLPTGEEVSRAVLQDAITCLGLFDPERAAVVQVLVDQLRLLISWRPAYHQGPLVPLVRVRLDRYADGLGISAPPVGKHGQRKSKDYVRAEILPDRVVVHLAELDEG